MSRLEGCSSLTRLPAMRISPPVIALEPGDRVEQRGLAAAGRADEHQEAALLDVEVDALQDLDGAEALLEVFDLEKCHAYPFTAPAIRPRTK